MSKKSLQMASFLSVFPGLSWLFLSGRRACFVAHFSLFEARRGFVWRFVWGSLVLRLGLSCVAKEALLECDRASMAVFLACNGFVLSTLRF